MAHAMVDDAMVGGADVVALPSAGSTPSPQGGATPAAGGRGAKKAKGEKPGKAIDWGRVNTLLEHFTLIYGTDTAWDGQTRRVVKVATMRLAFGNDYVKFWLAHADRRMVLLEDLVFEPGQQVAEHQINMWAGLELEPVQCTAADVRPMLKLLRHLCALSAETADEVDEVVDWVLRWMALPLQKPGTKMQTALVFHGPQGTGKNLFWDVWRDLFGRYGITVGQTELEDKFNDWLSCKLAIVGDEVVSRQEMYHTKNRLKLVVTQETKFPIRAIQQSTRWESNHANVVFLSNESQPLALEDKDRRYLVVYTPTADDTGLYEEVASFLADGGAGKWLHYLLSLELGDFSRHTKPLMTVAKEALIELGLKPAQRFMAEWAQGLLPLPVRVCSGDQLYTCFTRWAQAAGERFLPPKASFSRDAQRYVLERNERDKQGQKLEPGFTYKVVAMPNAEAASGRKSVRCWIPRGTGPLNGVTEGEWAAGCVDSFQVQVDRFMRPTAVGAE